METKSYFKKIVRVLTVFSILVIYNHSFIGSLRTEESDKEILSRVSSLQIPFFENRGQVGCNEVKYYAKTFAGTAFITQDGKITYSFPKVENEQIIRVGVIEESMIGAAIPFVKGLDKAITQVKYFKGNDPSKWQRNISTYHTVSLGEIYPGIELRLKAYGNNIEKLFYVESFADVTNIKVRIGGAKSLHVNDDGELELLTELGIVKFTKPVAFQNVAGKTSDVEVAYATNGREYGFEVGDYDETKELIIDPLLGSTFLGGRYSDRGYAVTIDGSGNVYVAGTTGSQDFPYTDAPLWKGWYDAFVSKFDANLTTLQASVFIGGGVPGENETKAEDFAYAIALDSNEDVYITGMTTSEDFPVTIIVEGADYHDRKEVFIAKLDGDNLDLQISRCFGTVKDERAHAITVDQNNNVFVGGSTTSKYFFPTTEGAYDTEFSPYSMREAFVSKFSGDLEILLASTLLGGRDTAGHPITDVSSTAVDNQGNIYVAGLTTDRYFPTTPNAYQTEASYVGVSKGFISKLDGNLQQLLASTFYGEQNTSIEDMVLWHVRDSQYRVYVCGNTYGSIYMSYRNAYDGLYNGGHDIFVAQFGGALETLHATTYLGGDQGENYVDSILMDSNGDVYVAGSTGASDFLRNQTGTIQITMAVNLTLSWRSSMSDCNSCLPAPFSAVATAIKPMQSP